MSGIVIAQDNRDEFHSGYNAAILRGLEKVGISAEGHAKDMCPVDTGRLRNSITHSVDNGDKTVAIGTNVEYAAYIELGTSRSDAQPYLVPSAENYAGEYRGLVESELKR